MPALDIKTLSFVALLTSLILPLVLVTSASFSAANQAATRTISRGASTYAAGFLLLSLRGVAPDWLVYFVGNMLVLVGFAELTVGFGQYFRGDARRTWMLVLLALQAPWLFWCVVIQPDASQRVLISSVFVGTVALVLVWEFMRAIQRLRMDGDPGVAAERRVLWALAVVFGLGAASFAWRGWVFAGVHGDIDATTLGGQTWGISFLVGVLFNIAMATSLPLLISRRNQREWLQSRELLGATEQLAQVASLVFESDTQRTSANRVLHHWLQVPQGKSLDLSVFLAAIETTARTELTAHIDQLLAGQGEQWTQECSLQCPDAKRLLIIHCGVRRGASGKRHLIVSAQDITSFRQATEAANQARDEAHRANAAKSDFLANMSHEIRTPMNGVLGLTRLCLEGDLPARERDLIEKCHASAQTLMGVVNDVLDFSKIEAGKLVLEHTALDLGRTVQAARSLFEQAAHAKGLRFVVDVGADVPLGLVGDPLRLSQVLNNLLSNAIKFTEHGEVRLEVRQRAVSDERVQLELTVQDSGLGIDADHLQRLFQPFSQADASTTRKFGGTGLGLAICRRLADLMGGTLTVQSTPGAGSRFTLCVTLQRSNLAPHAPTAGESGKPRRLAGLRILLVEDNPINVLVARLSLEGEGAQVVHRGDGQQAVDYLREHASEVDAVLMDIQMPVMDGYTATRAIRTELGLRQLPVVAMTANVLDTDRQASLEAGMDAHVGKPFDVNALVGVLLQCAASQSVSGVSPVIE